jgi:pimeloyl-ACP methyl ester carboxylesterase
VAAKNPIVLIHGYSDSARAFDPWMSILESRGCDVAAIHACSYRSLTNEVTIRDIAEGFDRALRLRAGLGDDQPFDAIVHSTGMLVIRAWLTAYAGRRERLRHLIGLAPATFGSPLAHKGRGWLGALFKGNRELGADFLEAGDRILDGLELGSRFTWDLAHADMLGDETFYGPTKRTPYVFVFCGSATYPGMKKLAQEDASDGVVRWSGCALNTRKIVLDLTEDPARPGSEKRISIAPWKNIDAAMVPIAGRNHSTILRNPGDQLADLVARALTVDSPAGYREWCEAAAATTRVEGKKPDEWQQFVIRAIDERGDPITDYNVQIFTRTARGRESEVTPFDMRVHTYRGDASLRCFHVNLTKAGIDRLENLWIRVIASSGSQLVGYQGYGSGPGNEPAGLSGDAKWSAELDISSLMDEKGVRFFYPFTTTLVELRLNREPLPLAGVNRVCWF